MRVTRINHEDPGSGYVLYDLLADGSEQKVLYRDEQYSMQFRGMQYGANNWLRVEGPDGKAKKWGWGWNSDVCYKCLDDMRGGWNKTDGRYKRYNKEAEKERGK